MAGIHYDWRYCYGGDDGYSTSITYNFSRSTAVAQVSLSMADGEGLCVCGFTQYRHRPKADGADKDVNYGWSMWYGYPPSVYDEHMTSVTASLVVGGSQQGVMTMNVWFF